MNPTIITGEPASGKSLLARNISLAFSEPVLIKAYGRKYLNDEPFLFQEVTKHTDLIIFDDLDDRNLEFFFWIIRQKYLKVERRGTMRFEIPTPKIIGVTDLPISGLQKILRPDQDLDHIHCFRDARGLFLQDKRIIFPLKKSITYQCKKI